MIIVLGRKKYHLKKGSKPLLDQKKKGRGSLRGRKRETAKNY